MKMKKLWISLLLMIFLTGCAEISEQEVEPLMNLEWFSEISEVRNQLTSYELLEERQNTDGAFQQDLLDYTGMELFETDCDLTLCFTSQGLVGFNYHDIKKNNSYREWFDKIETIYGVPTESGSGMASWYDNPVGKSTALYLFNLEEGVQISFYATSSTPDKSYTGKEGDEFFVPTPELRTPVVPVVNEPESDTTKAVSESGISSKMQTSAVVQAETTAYSEAENEETEESIGMIEETSEEELSSSGISSTAKVTTTSTSTTTTAKMTDSVMTTITEIKETDDFKQAELQFYASPESERQKMSGYTQIYEYRTEEPGQPWELIMEYENVPYMGKNCDSVLCFTSLGLVGINYFDSNISDYNYWVQTLTDLYGSPNETQYDYTAWSSSPVGNGTMIYVFALEDGVQISFFADDTGSELS